ncbi:superoxide dismutase family protein [Alkaliphilus sp. B6464]|uniref:superoxide dismutase family protein n=1 Tax=Alkaliphilus sp. B6464 TaxID=2731219 RepID=UPI001BADE6A7|nr:superoxide dismutase family protein [Alkaliphilus sp. B6464]
MNYYHQYTNSNQPVYYWSYDVNPANEYYPGSGCRNIAIATIQGGPLAPNIRGTVYFISAAGGTNVYVEVSGLPPYRPAIGNGNPIGPHGFHIHQNGTCEVGDPTDPFQAAGGHWNPTNQPHGSVYSLVVLYV